MRAAEPLDQRAHARVRAGPRLALGELREIGVRIRIALVPRDTGRMLDQLLQRHAVPRGALQVRLVIGHAIVERLDLPFLQRDPDERRHDRLADRARRPQRRIGVAVAEILVCDLAVLQHQQAGHVLMLQVVLQRVALAVHFVRHVGQHAGGVDERRGRAMVEHVARIVAIVVAKADHAIRLAPRQHPLRVGQRRVERCGARGQRDAAARRGGGQRGRRRGLRERRRRCAARDDGRCKRDAE